MMCKILPGRKREVLAFGCTFFFPVTRSVLGSGAVASVGSSSCGEINHQRCAARERCMVEITIYLSCV